ncbi:transposase IS4 [Nitzschia inconspicua]|uniref:Transposase IS4 n=1 Tax=Nitzschia inconspicua TaxID=303405 RepID=A0A9K3PL91_9STRA|nr:transposase IS4 [Nitzschia inconspicua]
MKLMSTYGSPIPLRDAKEKRRRVDGEVKTFKYTETFENHYRYRHAVDDHNNLRHSDISLEETWVTHRWENRAFAFILAITEVNAYLAMRYFVWRCGDKSFTVQQHVVTPKIYDAPSPPLSHTAQVTKRKNAPFNARVSKSLKMTVEDSTDKGGKTSDSEKSGMANFSASGQKEKDAPIVQKKKNLATKRLLTVPLFLKFVAVLLIKFVTDLVVFPALLLYRLAHNMKGKLMILFRKDSTSLNGEKPPS